MNKHINLNGIYDENADMIPLYSESGRILGSISPVLFEDFNNIKEKLVVGEVVYTFNEYLQMSGNFIREIVSAVEGIGMHPNLALILMDAINLYEGGSIPLTEDNISNAIEAYYNEVGSGYLRLVEICNNPDLYTYGNISTRFTNEYNKINELDVDLDFEERFNLDKDLSITGGTNKTFMEKSFLVENRKEDRYVPNTNGGFELELEKQEEAYKEEIDLTKPQFLNNPNSMEKEINLEEEIELEDNSHIVQDIEIVDSLSEEEVNVLLPKSVNQLSKNTEDGEENFLSILDIDSESSEETIELDSSLVALEEDEDWGKLNISVDSEEDNETQKLNSDLELITKELVFTDDSNDEDDEELSDNDEVPDIIEIPLEDDDEDSEINTEDSLTDKEELDLDIIEEFGTELKTLPKIEDTKGNVITSIHKGNENKIKEESERELKPIEPFEPTNEWSENEIKIEDSYKHTEPSVSIEDESKETEIKVEPISNNDEVDLPKEDTEKNNQDMLSMFERKMEEIITKTNEKHNVEVSRLNRKIEDLTKTIQVISEEKVTVKPVVEEPKVEVEVEKNTEPVKPVKVEDKVKSEPTDERDIEAVNVPIQPISTKVLDNIVNVKPIVPLSIEEDYTRNNRLIKSAHESKHQIYETKIEEKMSGTNKPKKPAHYIDEEIGYVFKSSVKVNERKEVKSEGLNKLEQERREIARQVLSSRGEF